jgi:hypothetical protein
MHRVVDVDVPLRVLDHRVRVAPLDVGRQAAPVVDRFEGVRAAAEHRRAGSGLVLQPDQRWGRGSRDELAPCSSDHCCPAMTS